MAATRAQLTTLYEQIIDLEAQKKDLNDQIKEAIVTFAENNDVNAKALKKSYRNYKDAQKDRAEFLVVEAATDELTDISLSLTPEV